MFSKRVFPVLLHQARPLWQRIDWAEADPEPWKLPGGTLEVSSTCSFLFSLFSPRFCSFLTSGTLSLPPSCCLGCQHAPKCDLSTQETKELQQLLSLTLTSKLPNQTFWASPYLLQNTAKTEHQNNLWTQSKWDKLSKKRYFPQISQFQGRQTFHFSRKLISEGEGMATTIIKGKRKLSNEKRKMHEFPFS